MKKIHIVTLFLFAVFLSSGCANTGAVISLKSDKNISEEKVINAISDEVKFHTRKRFIFLMAWNGIPVGTITAESGDMKRYKGRDVYVAKLVTESNKFLSKIYRVEDTYTSYIDAETNSSVRYEADRKEGNYRKHVVVEYDFVSMEAIYTNLTDGSVKRCSINKDVQDPLSTICYFMTLPLTPGQVIKLTVNLNEKNYNVQGKVENIRLIKLPRLGTFPAFKIRPYVSLGGKAVKKGKAWLYFAADETRYPLYGVVKIPFGKVTATLREVTTL